MAEIGGNVTGIQGDVSKPVATGSSLRCDPFRLFQPLTRRRTQTIVPAGPTGFGPRPVGKKEAFYAKKASFCSDRPLVAFILPRELLAERHVRRYEPRARRRPQRLHPIPSRQRMEYRRFFGASRSKLNQHY